jgi:hypothetical protein
MVFIFLFVTYGESVTSFGLLTELATPPRAVALRILILATGDHEHTKIPSRNWVFLYV